MLSDVDDLISEFDHLDEREACQYLDELGRELPEIPKSVYIDNNLVPGCQSRVWLVNRLTDDSPAKVEIQVDSDAFVVKGLAYVVLQIFGNQTPEEILATDYASLFDRMGLGRLILPQRKNGLYSMVDRIRNFAADSIGQSIEGEMAPGTSVVAPPIEISRTIDNIADEFPILNRQLPSGKRAIFLDSGASAQKPQCVIDKEREVEEQYYANAFRGRYYFGQRIDDEIEATRSKAAVLIGATRTDEIVFTSGTTMSVNLVAVSWGRKFLQPGDEVVVSEMAHHANYVPWQVIAKEAGATFRILPVTDEGIIDPASVESMINEKTAIVAISSMSNVLGTMNPIEQIAARAKACDAKLFVDAAQSIPHAPIDVADLGIDFLCFSGHKLYGPSGVGVLFGRHELLQAMDPFLYGGHMIETVGRAASTWAQPPAKFEAGTMPIVQIIGLGAAIDFVQSIGFAAIHAHEDRLMKAAYEKLSAIPGLKIIGPAPDSGHKGAILSFTIDGVSTEDLAHKLDHEGIFTRHGHHCAMLLHERLGIPATTRASFGLYNTMADVEALVAAVQAATTS